MRCNHHLYFETRCEHVSIHRRLSHVLPGPQDRIPSLGLKYLHLYKVRVDPGAMCRGLPNLLLDSLRSAMLYRFLHFECDRSRTFVGYRNNQSRFSYVVVCKWLSPTTPLLSEFIALLPVCIAELPSWGHTCRVHVLGGVGRQGRSDRPRGSHPTTTSGSMCLIYIQVWLQK